MKTGSVNHDVRITNGLIIVNTIFRNPPMTKQKLAAKVGMSMPTVTTILGYLQESGLVTQGEKQPSTGGRPAQLIVPVYGAAYSIGVYLSPAHARFCLTDLAPNLMAKKKYAVAMENTPTYWRQVHDCLTDFKQEFQIDDDKLLGIGFALSSPDRGLSNGTQTDSITILSGNRRISLDTRHIRDTFADSNIAILNDAKMAALAQRWGRTGTENFLYLSVNNNIAGAIVIGGDVLLPEKHNAEFGHMIVEPGGRQCVCGMNGCLDAYCSVTSLQTMTDMTLQEFFERLEQGDERLAQIWDAYLRRLTIAISNLRVIFELDIVIGGILSQYLIPYREELMRRFVQLHAAQHALLPDEEKEFLYVSDMGEFGSSMGTSLVFIDRYLSSIIK